jgi:transposase
MRGLHCESSNHNAEPQAERNRFHEKKVRFLGLDVHAETIAVAIAEADGSSTLGIILNREESVLKVVKKLGPAKQLQACYEAGPTGYVLYWQLTALGGKVRGRGLESGSGQSWGSGEGGSAGRHEVARSYRAGDLTAVWVPNQEHEALRELVRAREAAKQDQLRARHRLSKFLLRHGRRIPARIKIGPRTGLRSKCTLSKRRRNTRRWIPLHEVEHMADRIRRLEQAIGEAVQLAPSEMQEVIQALQALWGIAQISAVTIVVELGKISRFDRARRLMGYSGAVSSDHSSGKHIRRGQITKTGDAHLRRSRWRRRGQSTPSHHRGSLTQTPRGSERRRQRSRLEGTTPAA